MASNVSTTSGSDSFFVGDGGEAKPNGILPRNNGVLGRKSSQPPKNPSFFFRIFQDAVVDNFLDFSRPKSLKELNFPKQRKC